jgi:hypothetical protein
MCRSLLLALDGLKLAAFQRRTAKMKKLMTLMIGAALAIGAVSAYAGPSPAQKGTGKKSTGKKSTKSSKPAPAPATK